jgi:hypothetical protein
MDPADPVAMLRASCHLRSEQHFATFESALDLLAERLDSADLPDLHRAFDDSTEDYGAYWSLLHLIERYDFETAARVFVEVLPEMLPTARGWMETLAIRQLNDDGARSLLIDAARAAQPTERAALGTLLTGIAKTPESEPRDAVSLRAEQALAALR